MNIETLTREKNERSRKSRVFVTGGRIDRVTRLSPLPPPSFRLPSSSLKITLPPLPKAVCTRENTTHIAKQVARQRPDDQLATKTPSRVQTASKITRKTRTRESHSRRSRSDAREENPPTHRSSPFSATPCVGKSFGFSPKRSSLCTTDHVTQHSE